MATGTNTNTVTVNTFNGGAYTRVGKDTMRLRNAERTIDHRLTMTFTNVVGPRGSRLELSQKTGGTITGTFSAKITFTRGDLYREREINRTFTILLGGTNGTAVIRIDNTDYAADVQTGEIVSQ
jgi:hypothetical protein